MHNDVLYLNVGDAIDIRLAQASGATINLSASSTENFVSISKVTGPGSQSFYIQAPVKGAESGIAPGAGYLGNTSSCSYGGAIGLFGTAYATPVDANWTSIGTNRTLNKGTYLLTFAGSFELGAGNAVGDVLAYFRLRNTTAGVTIVRSDYAPLGYRHATDTIGDVLFSRPTFVHPYTVPTDGTEIRIEGVLDTTNATDETGLNTSALYSSGGYFCAILLN